MSNKVILVPTDFTEVSHSAIRHAMKLAGTISADVVLLNVVKDKEAVDEAKEKLAADEAFANEHGDGTNVKSIIRIGNIFDDIGDAAAELDASLIIMGTHGASGWQKVTGSYALKVITNSEVPFVVVQEKILRDTGYDSIVVPIDLHNETKQKLEIVADMANYFDSEVHLVTPNESDEFLKHKLNGNIQWSKKYLASKGVKCDAHIVEKGGSFINHLMEKAEELDADLISIMNLQKNSLMGMFGSSYEQAIITNELRIPALCVNPRQTSTGGTVFSR